MEKTCKPVVPLHTKRGNQINLCKCCDGNVFSRLVCFPLDAFRFLHFLHFCGPPGDATPPFPAYTQGKSKWFQNSENTERVCFTTSSYRKSMQMRQLVCVVCFLVASMGSQLFRYFLNLDILPGTPPASPSSHTLNGSPRGVKMQEIQNMVVPNGQIQKNMRALGPPLVVRFDLCILCMLTLDFFCICVT